MQTGLLTLGDHRPDPTTGERTLQAQRHRELLDYLERGCQAGFDLVIVGEHHFSDFIVSVPQIFLTWVAARHPDVRLATGVTLLPHHDPVRLAEDFATLDVVSDGRAEMWVGKGVNPAVYGLFGQDHSEAEDRQAEGLDLLVRLWTESDLTWSGQFRPPLDGVTLEPRPVQQPHVPIHVACSSPRSAAIAGRLGHGLTLTLLATPRDHVPPTIEAYRHAFAEAGHAHEPMVTVNAHVHVAPTSQEAHDHLGIYQFPFQRWVFGKRLGLPADEVRLPPHITELADPECAILSGSPSEVVDRIGRLRDACEFDRITYQGDYGGQPWPTVARSLDLFVEQVMPTVRNLQRTMA